MIKKEISVLAGYVLVYSFFLVIASSIVTWTFSKPSACTYWYAYGIASIIYIGGSFLLGFRVTYIK